MRHDEPGFPARHAWEYTQAVFCNHGPGTYDDISAALALVPGTKYRKRYDYTGMTEEQARLVAEAEVGFDDWSGAAREDDTITRKELKRQWSEHRRIFDSVTLSWNAEMHQLLVEYALAHGFSVPSEVLADYPGLAEAVEEVSV